MHRRFSDYRGCNGLNSWCQVLLGWVHRANLLLDKGALLQRQYLLDRQIKRSSCIRHQISLIILAERWRAFFSLKRENSLSACRRLDSFLKLLQQGRQCYLAFEVSRLWAYQGFSPNDWDRHLGERWLIEWIEFDALDAFSLLFLNIIRVSFTHLVKW